MKTLDDAKESGVTSLAKHDDAPKVLAATAPAELPFSEILRAAVERDMPVESLEKMLAMYQTVKADEARRAFGAAMAAFQADCPVIAKSSTASFETRGGARASYKYAELDEIANTIRACCAKHGLSYSWDCSTTQNLLTCVCTVRHSGGHSSTAQFAVPVDGGSPLMSTAQRHAATLTYAKRQSLVQALGLITGEPDDDGADNKGGPAITEHQAANIDALIDDVKADRAAFLTYFGVGKIADLPAAQHRKAIDMLEKKRGGR